MSATGVSRLARFWDSSLFDQFELFRYFDQPSRKHPMPCRPRILLLSVSAGNGHVRAAQAIEAHANKLFPGIEVCHLDVMQLMPAGFRKIYTDWYVKITSRFPEAWGWLYRITDGTRSSWIDTIRKKIEKSCAHAFFKEIESFNPDAIICTHFLPAELLSDLRHHKKLLCPVWVQVTDYDLHHMWVHAHVSGYFVATEELAYRLQAYGINKENIAITGIPVMPGFTAPLSRNDLANRFGLDPNRLTVMMMGGGAGVSEMATLTQKLLTLDQNFQLIVLAGKNKALLSSLNSLSVPPSKTLVALGFIQEVHALMACADLVITKPGGLSTSECLIMGVPMLLTNPIPGQEERNAAHLLQEGAAIRADDEVTLLYRLQNLLAQPLRLAQMRDRAKALARPEAASMVLKQVINAMHKKSPYEAT